MRASPTPSVPVKPRLRNACRSPAGDPAAGHDARRRPAASAEAASARHRSDHSDPCPRRRLGNARRHAADATPPRRPPGGLERRTRRIQLVEAVDDGNHETRPHQPPRRRAADAERRRQALDQPALRVLTGPRGGRHAEGDGLPGLPVPRDVEHPRQGGQGLSGSGVVRDLGPGDDHARWRKASVQRGRLARPAPGRRPFDRPVDEHGAGEADAAARAPAQPPHLLGLLPSERAPHAGAVPLRAASIARSRARCRVRGRGVRTHGFACARRSSLVGGADPGHARTAYAADSSARPSRPPSSVGPPSRQEIQSTRAGTPAAAYAASR